MTPFFLRIHEVDMIKNKTVRESYIWLALITVLSMTAMFSAGFDNNVVYYDVFVMSILMGIIILFNKDTLQLNRVSIVFLFFILWPFTSLFWSIYPIRTIIEGIQLISFLLVYLLTKKLTTESFTSR